jgi:NADH:ubiquinone oxidoreductase subunit 3 (subunit A)
MRRFLGIVVMVVSVIAGILLLATGILGSSRVAHYESGGTPSSYWQVTAVEFYLNWLLAVLLAATFAVGGPCTWLPQRRPPGT